MEWYLCIPYFLENSSSTLMECAHEFESGRKNGGGSIRFRQDLEGDVSLRAHF